MIERMTAEAEALIRDLPDEEKERIRSIQSTPLQHYSVVEAGDDFVITKYLPVYLEDGTVDAEKETWVVPAVLFDADYWKELEELENE